MKHWKTSVLIPIPFSDLGPQASMKLFYFSTRVQVMLLDFDIWVEFWSMIIKLGVEKSLGLTNHPSQFLQGMI